MSRWWEMFYWYSAHVLQIDGGKYTSFIHLRCNFIQDSIALKLHFLLSGSTGSSSDSDIHDSFSRGAWNIRISCVEGKWTWGTSLHSQMAMYYIHCKKRKREISASLMNIYPYLMVLERNIGFFLQS